MNAKRNILILVCTMSALCATPSARADFTFGEPVALETVIPAIDPAHESIDCFSSDGVEIYIESDRPEGSGGYDVWVLTRASPDEAWGPPQNLGPAVNSPKDDAHVSVSADGLVLYFTSNRPGGYGSWDIYMTTRTTKDDPWGQAVNMGTTINSSSSDSCPWISPDGLELYFVSYRAGGCGNADIWVARRATTNASWDSPLNLGPLLNSADIDGGISLSPDGLLLLFDSLRPGGHGNYDMWVARRLSVNAPWQTPVNLGPTVNGPVADGIPRLSPDGSTLYFTTQSGATFDNWQTPILPIVDFNGDDVVDGVDVCLMIDRWGTDDPQFDIGPMPWGDGIVDVQDLIVLAEHLTANVHDVNDPR